MTHKTTGRVAVPAVAMAVFLAFGGWLRAEDDVTVNNKPLSQWLTQLQSENRGLQVRAGRALAEAPKDVQPKIVPKLIPLLSAERENTRFPAAQALGEYGPVARAAVPALLPMLQGTEYERNRAAAAKALGQILQDAEPGEEVDKVTKALVQTFDDKYEDVRREAVTACGMIGPSAKVCIPDLQKRLGDALPIRNAAAWTCGRMGKLAEGYIDRLISNLHGDTLLDRNTERTPAVPDAIGILGPVHQNVVPNLVDKLEKIHAGTGFYVQEPGELMRFYAMHILMAFERIGPKAAPAAPYLNRMISSPGRLRDWEQTGLAIRAIGAIGPAAAEAAPALKTLLDEKNRPRHIPEADWGKLRDTAIAAWASVQGRGPKGEEEGGKK